MNMTILHDFFKHATCEVAALDYFVEQQRQVHAAIRSRAWPELELTMQKANLAASMVADEEAARHMVWQELLRQYQLPEDSDAKTVCATIPEDFRGMMSGACRNLRLAATRAKLENDALRSFAGTMAQNLASIIHELFPERKGAIYGPTGIIRKADANPIVLDTAF
jgi:hypothetical protein